MVFNFYLNSKPEQNNTEDLEEVMKKLETHFADWNDFYMFFTRTAGIPKRNADKIQQFFNDLREDFVNIVKQYNEDIRHFADIHEENAHVSNFEDEVVKHMKNMMESTLKEDKKDFNMYN